RGRCRASGGLAHHLGTAGSQRAARALDDSACADALTRPDADQPDGGMAATWLERLVDGRQHAVRCVRRACDVGVRKDGEELRRRAPKDSWSVDIADGAGERRGHRLQRFVCSADSVGFDEENAKVALVSVRTRELVLEDGAHESIVEEAGRAVDDVKWLGLRVVDLDATGGTEDRAGWQGGTAGLTGHRVRPAPGGGVRRRPE